MNIYIPTYGRPERQITFLAMPPALQKRCMFVVRREEAVEIKRLWGKVCQGVLIQDSKGVAAARQSAITHSPYDKVCFLDDDLRFCRRVEDWDYTTNNRLRKAEPKDVEEAIKWIETCLNGFACVSLGARMGNNGSSGRHRWHNENYRVMRSFGVKKSVLKSLGLRFDDFYYWEDFHVALSLVEHGYPNLVSNDHCTDGVTNSKGGVQRDVSRLREVAARFAKLHPHAKMKEKTFRWGEGVLTAPDFTIAWKKAYRSKLS